MARHAHHVFTVAVCVACGLLAVAAGWYVSHGGWWLIGTPAAVGGVGLTFLVLSRGDHLSPRAARDALTLLWIAAPGLTVSAYYAVGAAFFDPAYNLNAPLAGAFLGAAPALGLAILASALLSERMSVRHCVAPPATSSTLRRLKGNGLLPPKDGARVSVAERLAAAQPGEPIDLPQPVEDQEHEETLVTAPWPEWPLRNVGR